MELRKIGGSVVLLFLRTSRFSKLQSFRNKTGRKEMER